MEAPPRLELGIKVLQTSALPLGYDAIGISTHFCVDTCKMEREATAWAVETAKAKGFTEMVPGKEVKAGDRVLDLGCGTGVLCRFLRDRGIRAAGMDLSQGMIAIARKEDPEGRYDVGDMTCYRSEVPVELVTCTGDALNHIPDLRDVETILKNVYGYLAPGGYFVFDLLNENEVSDSEPFEMDFSETVRVWFQMTRPETNQVNLKVRVFENGQLQFEENIRETVYDPEEISKLLEKCGFSAVKWGVFTLCCANSIRTPSNTKTRSKSSSVPRFSLCVTKKSLFQYIFKN